MKEIKNSELIEKARSLLNPIKINNYLVADVGCALLSENNNIYYGVCIDVSSGMGFCAEHSAIASMITAGEYKIKKIVAVCENNNEVFILSPCGRCREFMRQINNENINAEIILDTEKIVKLYELLPYYDWYKKI